MKAYVFAGQGSQFEGMGKDLYEQSEPVRQLMEQANDIVGFRLTDVMFEGSAEDLKATRITQPAVFLHSIAKVTAAAEAFQPDVVAGHSLGEFSSLVAAKAMSFENGLKLVQQRAEAMQKACEMEKSTMAAILGLEDEVVEKACEEVDGTVVAANYNCPGQLVISGSVEAVEAAVEKLKEQGAKRAVILAVGGAFHSPFMQPAQEQLKSAIDQTTIEVPTVAVYQNVSARPEKDPAVIKKQLIEQLTAPVRWTQTMKQMIDDGVTEFIEVGGVGKVLQGFVKKVDRKFPTAAL